MKTSMHAEKRVISSLFSVQCQGDIPWLWHSPALMASNLKLRVLSNERKQYHQYLPLFCQRTSFRQLLGVAVLFCGRVAHCGAL